MRRALSLSTACALAVAGMLSGCASTPASGPLGFFVTSVGSGQGGNLGGLAGADAHCQKLAAASGASGAGARTWRAYLSLPPIFATASAAAVPAVNARDRIGAGPWYNAAGVLVARDATELHAGGAITKATALDERGRTVNGRGDTPNEHDILTGSRDDGTAFAPQADTTCRAWTSSTEGSAIVGHHDRIGPLPENWAKSWNFSHPSAGCSQEALVRTGGSGRFYCFAAN
ncbi:hypothetical protein [Aquabacterium sp. OR-4]|uniref:hypothetical protein n=1 Tax=Aquabacterium sp. OR-4 TaxID=2978127 RepID=UPI0021B255ED